jgi:hypothetical protein
MKDLALYIFVATGLGLMPVRAAEENEHWPKVSTGDYKGYAELYAVSDGVYIIEGHTNLGEECSFKVSSKGVDYGGEFFRWDAPGLQASRNTKEGHQRINFRGKVGNVVVADLILEDPKGKIVNVLRMSVALAPAEMTQK